jgi:iron complex outermembrane recepter protein
MLHRLSRLIPLALLPTLLLAQSGAPRLGGVVTADGAPVVGASVTAADLQGRGGGTRTDTQGRYFIELPGVGRYTVQVRAEGRAPVARAVDVRAGTGATADFQLARATLIPVQVIGGGRAVPELHPGANALAGSVSVLSGDQIAREQVAFSQELLKKVPGVYRAEFNQGIINGDIGVRGFNTESDIASTKLLIDGIPSNMNSGVSEMNALFPLEIAQIEVVRGTNDARYGLFNLAGNVNVATPRGGNYFSSRLQAGSFGATDAQLLHAVGARGFSQTLFVGARRSDGFRDNSEMDKWSASGKWFYDAPSGRVRVGTIVRTHRLDTRAPGYLTQPQSRATPQFSPAFSSSDGGTVASDHGSLHLDVQQTRTLAWSLKSYLQRFNRIRYVRFTAAGAQQERLEDEHQRGAIALVTWRPAALEGVRGTVTGGLDVQRQNNLQQRYRTLERARQATLRNYDFTLNNSGGFAQLALSPVSALSLTGGVRVDRFAGSFLNTPNTGTPTTTPLLDFGWIPQPRASATLKVTDAVSAYGNWGRSFQIGTGIATYGRSPLQESRNSGAEAGLILAPTSRVTVRGGVWQQRASDEVRLRFDNSGDSENIGRTLRRGVDIESTVQLPGQVSLWVTGTSQRAVLEEPGAANAAARGKRLNHVPAWTAKYGADWLPTPGLRLAGWAYAQDDYEIVDVNNRGRFGAQHVVNTDVSYRWRSTNVGLGVTNLFNQYIEYAWWDGTQTLHSPGNGRGLFLSVGFDR